MEKLRLEDISAIVVNLKKKIESFEKLIEEKNCFCAGNEKSKTPLIKSRCCSNFSKSELAQFFYILMEEKILFFDNLNQKSNRSKMQWFIEKNFTYCGDAGRQTRIMTISKQFSESKGFTYREKQLRFLDEIINKLEIRRAKLASR